MNESATFTIEYLADHPEHLPTLARWHHDQWADLNPGDTVEKRRARMQGHLGRRQIPTTFVVLSNGEPLGSACLVADDMHKQLDLTPWLASVYVDPEHRRRGVGRAVVRRVVEEACALGVGTLFLFTPDREDFYSHMGWKVRLRTTYMQEQVVVMQLDLEPD